MIRSMTAAVACSAALLLFACSDDAEKSTPDKTDGAAAATATPETPAAKPSLTYYTIPG